MKLTDAAKEILSILSIIAMYVLAGASAIAIIVLIHVFIHPAVALIVFCVFFVLYTHWVEC